MSPSWISAATSGGSSRRRGLADGLAEKDEASGGEGEGARLGDRRGGAADVGLVELERGRELDDRGGRVPGRREVVADVALATAVADDARPRERRLERRAHLVGATLEEVGVQPLEAVARARGEPPGARRYAGPRSAAGEPMWPATSGVTAPDPCVLTPARLPRSLVLSRNVARAVRRQALGKHALDVVSSSSVSFQRSKTRVPAGLRPPVSAATTTGTLGPLGPQPVGIPERATATSPPPSRTTTSASVSRRSRRAVRCGQLLDLEVAALEQEARELHEARVAAGDEHPCPRLGRVLPERAGGLRARVGHRCGRPTRPGRRPRARAARTRPPRARRPLSLRGTRPFATASAFRSIAITT